MHLAYIAVWTTFLSGAKELVALRRLSLYRRLADQAGQTLAEYAILLSSIASAGLLTAFLVFQDGITAAFSDSSDCVQGTCVANFDNDDDDDDDDDD